MIHNDKWPILMLCDKQNVYSVLNDNVSVRLTITTTGKCRSRKKRCRLSYVCVIYVSQRTVLAQFKDNLYLIAHKKIKKSLNSKVSLIKHHCNYTSKYNKLLSIKYSTMNTCDINQFAINACPVLNTSYTVSFQDDPVKNL